MKRLIAVISISFFMQACVGAPVIPPEKQPESQSDYSSRFSVEGIKQRREAEYSQKLAELNTRNPEQDAQQVISTGNYYLLAYQSGRGGSTKVPGLTQQQSENIACELKQLDGLGDSIYGENHLKYRVALRKYANQFNQVMVAYCQ